MGIGHVAVALSLKPADRRVNAGLLIFAAFFADFLLGWCVLAGWESYQVAADYAHRHYLLFTFPWSHGLVPLLVWSAALALLCRAFLRGSRAALLVAVAAASHFVLDALVHVRGLPLAGPGSFALGLGLWRNLPLELGIEAAMTVAALALYLRATRDHSRGRRAAMVVYVVLLAFLMISGQAAATDPPRRAELLSSWIAAPVLLSAIAAWLDRRPRGHAII
ncbi:MAG: hypothetical protein LAP87_03375 [Acidobacteriia bacterium]|nr:hypothetical protein [Terriglobia bacterium]